MKICEKHGELNETNSYMEKCYKSKELKFRVRCKQCKSEKDETYRKLNRRKLVEKNTLYKAKNRDIVNAWNRQDRKNNPEKYKRYEDNYKNKHGIEKIRKSEVARIHGLTIDEYEILIESHENKCAICKKEETRIGRDGKTVTPLCIDHCHKCEESGVHVIRGLLCHACNTALGKLKDNIDVIKNVISYLEKHNHVE